MAVLPKSPSNNKPLPGGNLDLVSAQPGESPLDFIRKNSQIETPVGASNAATPSVPEQIFNKAKEEHGKENANQQASPKPTEAPKQEDKSVKAPSEPEPTFGDDARKSAPAELERDDTDGDSTEELTEEVSAAARESFKALQSKFKEVKKTLKEKQKEAEEAKRRLEEIDTGRALPKVVEEKENEIKRLKPYEEIVNLKSSKEYQEKYVKPLDERRTRLKNIFTDYEIPAEVQDQLIDRAINTNSERELNEFVAENFDPVGALEVKGIINAVKGLTKEAQEAEKSPAQVLAKLQTEGAQVREAADRERKIKIYENAKGSWRNTLGRIRGEGKLLELIPRDNDPEFNEKFVAPILKQASQDFEAMVKELAEAGAQNIPETTLNALAASFLQAHATGMAVATRDNALKHIQALEQGADRLTGLIRPNVGGGVSRGPSAAPARALTPQEEAQSITQSILSKRR